MIFKYFNELLVCSSVIITIIFVQKYNRLESLEHTTFVPEEDLQIVIIPKSLHEDFNCVVGKHVFIDKPWTKIARKKIIKDLQSSDSCFSKLKKKLEVKANC